MSREEMINPQVEGIIFDIKRFALQDGPGIRTTVFLKGCPLNCAWCHNPESINKEPEIAFYEERCIGCGRCAEVCEAGVHIFTNGKREIRRELCKHCGRCFEVCHARAIMQIGCSVSVEEVLKEVERDRPFYENSGGGVTLSGGEPTLQPEFVTNLLGECRKRKIHTALDTSGYANWPVMEEMLRYVDLILLDLKVIDKEKHKRLTGVTNDLILENTKRIVRNGFSIILRLPLISDINDSDSDKKMMQEFVTELLRLGEIRAIELLPYNELAESKYRLIGEEYKLKELKPLSKETVSRWQRAMELCGVGVIVK